MSAKRAAKTHVILMTKQGREFMQRVRAGGWLSIPDRASIAMKTLDVTTVIADEVVTAVGQVREDGVAEATVYLGNQVLMKMDGETYVFNIIIDDFSDDDAVFGVVEDVGVALHAAYPAFTSERD